MGGNSSITYFRKLSNCGRSHEHELYYITIQTLKQKKLASHSAFVERDEAEALQLFLPRKATPDKPFLETVLALGKSIPDSHRYLCGMRETSMSRQIERNTMPKLSDIGQRKMLTLNEIMAAFF